MSELSAIDLVIGCNDNQFFVNALICSIHQTFKTQSEYFNNLKIHILDDQISPQNQKLIEQQFNTDQKKFSTNWQLQFYPIDWFRGFARKYNIPQYHGTDVPYSKIPMLKSIEPISDFIFFHDADNFMLQPFSEYFQSNQNHAILGCYIYPHYRNCYNKKMKGALGGSPFIIRYQKFMEQYYEPFMEKIKQKLLYKAIDEWLLIGIVGSDYFDLGVGIADYPSSLVSFDKDAPWNKNHYDTLEFEKLNQIYQETIIANRTDLLVEKAVQPIPTYEDVNVKLFPQIFAWIKFRVMKTYFLQKLIRKILPVKYL